MNTNSNNQNTGALESNYSLDELNLESSLGAAGEHKVREIRQIDMSNFTERKNIIADELWAAATEVGFFQLSHHGLDIDFINSAFANAERFFALPENVKTKYPLKGGGLNAGWESRAQVRPSTKTADQKESFQLTRPHMDGVWPSESELNGFQKQLLDFEMATWKLGMKVLSCFALKLGFPEDFFKDAHSPQQEGYQCTLRLLHYFPLVAKSEVNTTEALSQEKKLWRAGAHTDFDCLTLLFQRPGQGGLEVCPGKEAETQQWTEVKPKAGLVTCNIGDMLMRWSDDQLKSTLHRVSMPRPDEYLGSRYSMAFFCQANKPVMIQGPLKKYQEITAEEYLKQRIAANFSY